MPEFINLGHSEYKNPGLPFENGSVTKWRTIQNGVGPICFSPHNSDLVRPILMIFFKRKVTTLSFIFVLTDFFQPFRFCRQIRKFKKTIFRYWCFLCTPIILKLWSKIFQINIVANFSSFKMIPSDFWYLQQYRR